MTKTLNRKVSSNSIENETGIIAPIMATAYVLQYAVFIYCIMEKANSRLNDHASKIELIIQNIICTTNIDQYGNPALKKK